MSNPTGLAVITTSEYLLESRKRRCRKLLGKECLGEEDIIEIYLALHFVLEIGLNGLFRELYLPEIKKGLSWKDVAKNIDEISFRDKLTLFIYNSPFDFGSKIDEAKRRHSVIEETRQFCKVRNQLIHGHLIRTERYVNVDVKKSKEIKSPTRLLLTEERLGEQLERFRYIVESTRFYLEHFDEKRLPKRKKELLIKEYLDLGFLKRE